MRKLLRSIQRAVFLSAVHSVSTLSLIWFSVLITLYHRLGKLESNKVCFGYNSALRSRSHICRAESSPGPVAAHKLETEAWQRPSHADLWERLSFLKKKRCISIILNYVYMHGCVPVYMCIMPESSDPPVTGVTGCSALSNMDAEFWNSAWVLFKSSNCF